jgi:hypothetical protein
MKGYSVLLLSLLLVAPVLLIRTTRARAEDGDGGSEASLVRGLSTSRQTQSAYATGRRLRPAHRHSSSWRRMRPVELSRKPTRNSTPTAQDQRFP